MWVCGSYAGAALAGATCEICFYFFLNFNIRVTHGIIGSLCGGGSGGGGGGGSSSFLNLFGHLDVKRALSG